MEPRIQYAKTKDGVNIAYRTLGEGEPAMLSMDGLASHLQLASQIQGLERLYTLLAEHRMVVRFDFRGFGMSQHDVERPSLDAWLLDIKAVVDHLGLATFALNGVAYAGLVAIAFAAGHPDRISHLILQDTAARGSDLPSDTPQSLREDTLESLRETDTAAWADLLAFRSGLTDRAEAGKVADFFRESADPKARSAALEVIRDVDTLDMLPLVKAPTLITHRQKRALDVDVARTLAARIPNARLVLRDRVSMALLPPEEQKEAMRVYIDFLADGEGAKPATAQGVATVHTILFTDIQSSTALRRRLGDAQVQELLRTHNVIVRDALRASGGSEIKHTGDGIMASFMTASSALECAIAIQQAVASHRQEFPDPPLGVYIGLNAGEPIAEDDDLFGTSVDLAARLVDHAQSGQIIASDVVRQLAAGKQFLFADLGETELRGFEDPVKLWELRWQEID